MKKWVVTGILGVAGISAFAIYAAQKPQDPVVVMPAPAASSEDIRAQFTEDRPIRSVESQEAQSALERMGLWAPSDTVSWDARTGENGNYIFSNLNVSFENDDGSDVISAAEFEITGVRLINGDMPYYDTVTATDLDMYVTGDKTDITANRIGIKMPDADTVNAGLKDRSGDLSNSPIKYIAGLMEPGTLQTLPEVFVENLQTSTTKDIRIYGAGSLDILDRMNEQSKPVKKQVKDTTSTGFAALSKITGTDTYNWQISNFSAETHDFMGRKNRAELAFLDLSGLDSKILEKLSLDGPPMNGRFGDPFTPIFATLNLQGFRYESETDIFHLGQASIVHSDSRADQFSRHIDIPQMTVSTKPVPETNEGRPRSGNPFAKLGYDKVDLSLSSKTDFDKTTGTITDNGTWLRASDVFEIALSYKVSNIKSGLAALMMLGGGAPESPVIEFGEFDFTDKGILDRVHSQFSKERNMSIEDAKAATKASFFAMKMVAKSDYQKELATEATQAYGALIDHGGKLRIRLRPQRPVSFKDYLDGIEQKQAQRIYRSKDKDIENSKADVQQDSLDNFLRSLNISVQHSIAD